MLYIFVGVATGLSTREESLDWAPYHSVGGGAFFREGSLDWAPYSVGGGVFF